MKTMIRFSLVVVLTHASCLIAEELPHQKHHGAEAFEHVVKALKLSNEQKEKLSLLMSRHHKSGAENNGSGSSVSLDKSHYSELRKILSDEQLDMFLNMHKKEHM